MTPYFLLRGVPVEVVSVDIDLAPSGLRVWGDACTACGEVIARPIGRYGRVSKFNRVVVWTSALNCAELDVCYACAEKARAALGVPYLDALKQALEDRA